MDIADKLQALIAYYNVTRGVGHTKTMLEGAFLHRCIVLAKDSRQARDFNRRSGVITSVGCNDLNSLLGLRLPLAIDNAVLWTLMAEAWSCIQDLRKENVRLRGWPGTRADASARSGQASIVIPRLFDSVDAMCHTLQDEQERRCFGE